MTFYQLLVFLLIYPLSQDQSELQIVITNTKNDQGLVQVLLFKSKDGFPDVPEKAFKSFQSKIENNQASISLSEIPKGKYAISAFHDTDGDGKMRTGMFGVPKDRYGFSNDAKGRMGPPSFEDASFVVSGDKKEKILINLR
jgi:uncharacterized protein (DUF2141 family)